jgi:oxygen-independent coproporphyrinogen-3 oxidase
VETLQREAVLWADWPVEFDTLYLGGGTPSMLNPGQLEKIIDTVSTVLPVADDVRLFMEVNPEDVSTESVTAWRDLGVATISLGTQSFVDEELKHLGRRHTAEQGQRAVECCLEAGFDTVSVDLIFGLPRQSPQQLKQSLRVIEQLSPHHVSGYQLTIHEGTTFGRWRDRGKLTELPDSGQWALFELLHDELGAAGWKAYEVSNFSASPQHRSAHNLKYWNHSPYLGLGPSAHSFDGRNRWWNVRTTRAYEQLLTNGERPIEASEQLSAAELALETVMLGLRTTSGIERKTFQARFGFDLASHNQSLLEDLTDRGLLVVDTISIAPTLAGLAVADGLAAQFELATG